VRGFWVGRERRGAATGDHRRKSSRERGKTAHRAPPRPEPRSPGKGASATGAVHTPQRAQPSLESARGAAQVALEAASPPQPESRRQPPPTLSPRTPRSSKPKVITTDKWIFFN